MSVRRPPVWLVPNLLSLDAPLVAVAWLYIFAKTWRVMYHPWPVYLALALVVWGIYAADRLLDAALHGDDEKLPLRHQMHRRLRKVLMVLVPAALLGALGIALFLLPREIFSYAVIVGVLVLGFFATALFSGGRREVPYVKNLLAGLAFAYGTALGAHVYMPANDVFDLVSSPEMLSFGILCMLNITAVDLWEHARRSHDPEVRASDELALTLPLAVLGVIALLYTAFFERGILLRPFYISILVSTGALMVVNRVRHRLSTDSLRVIADLCLLAPWIYFVVA